MKHKILIAFLFISSFIFSQSGTKNFIDQPYLDVTGTSEIEITPNEIYVKITLNENRSKKSIETQETQLLQALRQLNLDIDNCLSVLDFDGYYQRKFLSSNEVIKTKTYQLIVTNGKTLSEVFKALDDLKIFNASIMKISHSDLEKFRRENKIKAIKIAKEKAQDYATALGQTIGKAIYIEEHQFNHTINSNYSNEVYAVGYAKKRESSFENIMMHKIPIKSSVQVKFILN